MSDLDDRRLSKMKQRGGLSSVDELVAMWRATGEISFPLANERTVVTEARRRIREAGRRLGKKEIRTLQHNESGKMFGLMEYTPQEEAEQGDRLRQVMTVIYRKT